MVQRIHVAVLTVLVAVTLASAAYAQSAGECSGGVCGTPQTSGGSQPCVCTDNQPCNCAGSGAAGSILINNTDEGDTYQYADDYDEDGIEDDYDNCPYVKNKSQADQDGDKIGDGCDICPAKADTTQLDVDGDGIGDVCDSDADNDGLPNAQDNCKLVANIDQVDTDKDKSGDACDADDDNDAVLDGDDNCPLVSNPLQKNTDPNSYGDACDNDDDKDNLDNAKDNCPAVPNPDQKDVDVDGVGDLCDSDLDGDGVLNLKDNCPALRNAAQTDIDRDGRGDTCDARFCYVIARDEKNCLDPLSTFQVYSPFTQATTGKATRLRLFANRRNAAIQYKWIVVSQPEGSGATVQNPQGTVRVSTPYEYHYLRGSVASFTPDEPGQYTIKVVASLVFPDVVNPSYPRQATYLVTVVAEGDSLGGCAMGGTSCSGLGLLPLLLLGLGLALRRRSR